jgi:hypothetical protein
MLFTVVHAPLLLDPVAPPEAVPPPEIVPAPEPPDVEPEVPPDPTPEPPPEDLPPPEVEPEAPPGPILPAPAFPPLLTVPPVRIVALELTSPEPAPPLAPATPPSSLADEQMGVAVEHRPSAPHVPTMSGVLQEPVEHAEQEAPQVLPAHACFAVRLFVPRDFVLSQAPAEASRPTTRRSSLVCWIMIVSSGSPMGAIREFDHSASAKKIRAVAFITITA